MHLGPRSRDDIPDFAPILFGPTRHGFGLARSGRAPSASSILYEHRESIWDVDLPLVDSIADAEDSLELRLALCFPTNVVCAENSRITAIFI